MQNDFDFPLLVVAGFPRTGSTSIYRNLELHPGFAVPVRKELNFFCRANQPLASYKAHFPRHRQGQILVDVSPAYCLDPEVAPRLRAAVPQARVVLQIREPAGWIRSLYTQMCSFTPHPPTFAEFLEHPMMEQFNQQFRFSLSEGIYRRSLAAFGKAFGDNLLITDFAAFERNPLEVLREIEAFAGASNYFSADTVDARTHNSSRLARRHSPRLRWLLGKESVVQTAAKVVPARLLRRARSMLYYEGGANQPAPPVTPEHEHDVAIARAATAADREAYVELFSTTAVRRGSEFG
jgi:sulfotransferase family protein